MNEIWTINMFHFFFFPSVNLFIGIAVSVIPHNQVHKVREKRTLIR